MTPPRKRSPRNKPIKLDPAKDHIIKFPHALAPDVRASTIAFAQAISHPASARPRGDRHYEEGWPEEDAVAQRMAKLAEAVAEPTATDPAELYRQHRAQNPIPSLESIRADAIAKKAEADVMAWTARTAETAALNPMPTPVHAIPEKGVAPEPESHARPKSEPSWPKAAGEVLAYLACILVALPTGAVLLDAFVYLAIHAWGPVGAFLSAVRP